MHPKWSRISPTISADFPPNFSRMTWDAYFGLPLRVQFCWFFSCFLQSIRTWLRRVLEGMRRRHVSARTHFVPFWRIPRAHLSGYYTFFITHSHIFRFGLVAVRAGEITRRIHIEPAIRRGSLTVDQFPPLPLLPFHTILRNSSCYILFSILKASARLRITRDRMRAMAMKDRTESEGDAKTND